VLLCLNIKLCRSVQTYKPPSGPSRHWRLRLVEQQSTQHAAMLMLADTERSPSIPLDRLVDCYLTDRSIDAGSRWCWQQCGCSEWIQVNDLEVGAAVYMLECLLDPSRIVAAEYAPLQDTVCVVLPGSDAFVAPAQRTTTWHQPLHQALSACEM
jgi:hypothetical protein